jgi:hypothetical protein
MIRDSWRPIKISFADKNKRKMKDDRQKTEYFPDCAVCTIPLAAKYHMLGDERGLGRS